MGLTKRGDGWYVEFRMVDSEVGKSLVLAPRVPGARLKRWKVGGSNKTVAKEHEATIKTQLIQGKIVTEQGAASAMTFGALVDKYLALPAIQAQASYPEKAARLRERFIPLFCGRIISSITPAMIEDYRTTRKGEAGRDGVR